MMAVQVRERQQVEYKFVFPLLTSFVVSMHGYRLAPVRHVVNLSPRDRAGGGSLVLQHLWTESCAPLRMFRHTVSSCPKSHVWMLVGKAVVARLLRAWRRVTVWIGVGGAMLGLCTAMIIGF